MLVIADAAKPVAVAGVMGGATSGILPATRTVLLESACFKPTRVRRCAKQLGMLTESSYRFERGVDINLADWASRHATALMLQLAGGTTANGGHRRLRGPTAPRTIACRFERARQLLGAPLDDAEALPHLRGA